MRKKKSFTLIELLVVVAIIAVLVAILLPALGKARESARGISCSANLRQVGVSVSMYTDMFNEYLPNCNFSGWWYNWSFKLIQAGLVNSAIGSCYNTAWTGNDPSSVFKGIKEAGPGEVKTIFHCPSLSSGDLVGSGKYYYVNAFGSPEGVMGITRGGYPDFARLPMFERLDYTIAAFDSTFLRDSPTGDVGSPWATSSYTLDISERHRDGANCLFLDSHVTNVKPGRIIGDREMFPDRAWLVLPH